MDDTLHQSLPKQYEAILTGSRQLGFTMPSDRQTGALLRVLAASKPNGRLLELGTGTGLGTSWILDGMNSGATLISIESDASFQAIANRHLRDDHRLTLMNCDGLSFLKKAESESFDFIYADTWPGKYIAFDHSLRLLRRGGIILLDDMLPQPNWPVDHPEKVEALLATIAKLSTEQFHVVRQRWYTGHILIVKR